MSIIYRESSVIGNRVGISRGHDQNTSDTGDYGLGYGIVSGNLNYVNDGDNVGRNK